MAPAWHQWLLAEGDKNRTWREFPSLLNAMALALLVQ
jgi:hypothetical protein